MVRINSMNLFVENEKERQTMRPGSVARRTVMGVVPAALFPCNDKGDETEEEMDGGMGEEGGDFAAKTNSTSSSSAV